MRVLHIITDFDDGGAQAVLCRFVTADRKDEHQVISLMNIGAYGERILEMGIKVYALDMPKSQLTIDGLIKLYKLIRTIDPDIIQTWMYHSDFVGSIVARLAGKKTVVWGIHNTNLDPAKTSKSTRAIVRACGLLSKNLPRKIVSCSQEGVRVHAKLGYQSQKMVVIPNGYDISEFAPQPDSRSKLRALWQIPENTTLFGMVARWNPQKDHANLIAALAELKERVQSPWHCVTIGSNMSEDNQVLLDLLDRAGVRDRVTLLGIRTDIPAVMSALDFHVLSSAYGEAFPNVVAEAMACETPCIVTEVGDSALIVGDTGWVVPSSDPVGLATAMAAAIQALADLPGLKDRQTKCRQRIEANFNLQIMIERYQQLWASCVLEPQH
ncbi:glycosyltransferase [Chamaesiphon sp. VAR_48_metabat_403]|uniref:glycosyltransferase family 4 protein n=1 Tax=Chamaesiphon sp. VAR_48_metabat_403 TaxID=2964700 RepID=UPI00286DF1A4|nr:glycosyltransferase [Chamaesiphon sp. VAR_48_metabat_403]